MSDKKIVMHDKKIVSFTYDSVEKSIKMTFQNNVVIKNSGESKTLDSNLDVLDHEPFVFEVAKECIEEMLSLINEKV